ncbi:hypothetical protein AI29_02265 [bacteria symbiont BFo2 of Frankliniella occidentalis]|nr:hypothetical protein AI29_02265 [bacteria symbiont BFo2 of Frankliniella occidentalis]KYP92785.1 hypothetical protein WB60_04535 [bacteria symbiont BFo2 of Frankliniella occidentalis]KYP92880.1 hypothetical protein WB67_15545 [bacteria symbiont BFo2 of Frankliniella occidentalis]
MPRYPQLDCLRGIAILGILLLNIVSFALPSAAYLNPAWQGPPSDTDTLVWGILELFAEMKFLSLLGLLFGAGIIFQLPRGLPWITHRLLWLIVIGVLHGILLWQGDILLSWGLTGLLVYRVIAYSDRSENLLRTGVIFYLFGVGLLAGYALVSGHQPGSDWLPQPADIAAERTVALKGGWLAIHDRLEQFDGRLLALVTQYGWELAGLMMIGAALTRQGWLLGQRSVGHYRRCYRYLLPIGFMLTATSVALQYATGWAFRWSGFWLQIPLELGTPFIAVGYIALFHAHWQRLSGWRLTSLLIQVGRMALSNYLLQTLVCTTVFSVLGYFMALTRSQLLAVVPLVWLLNLAFSYYWLRYFRQGPLEWCWRRLTRWTAGV